MREEFAMLENSEFGNRIREAERAELSGRRFEEAAGLYRSALAVAGLSWEKAYASFLFARSEWKAGRRPEAHSHYRSVLQTPLEHQDEYGIPLALYAASALLDSAQERAETARVLQRLASGGLSALSSPALAMMRNLATKNKAADLQPELAHMVHERE